MSLPFWCQGEIKSFFRLWVAMVIVAMPPVSLAESFQTVVIDPGHGGKDKGASWYGVHEKTLTLDVSKRLEKRLRDAGIPTVMTRREDVYKSLAERAEISNRFSDAIFVSIHFNAHTNRSIHGLETFYLSPKGRAIADVVQSKIAARIQGRNRGTKRGNYKVLLLTNAPAILIEGGFISNRAECRRVQTEWYRDTISKAIADALISLR